MLPNPVKLKTKDIAEIFLYEFGLASLNYIVFISLVLGTMYSLILSHSMPATSEGKLLGAVAASSGIWFSLSAFALSIADYLNNQNHLRNITDFQYYINTKLNYNLNYSRFINALYRTLGVIGTNLIFSGILARYMFSLSTEEITSFLLIISATPLAATSIATIIGVPAIFLYKQTDSYRVSQTKKLNTLIAQSARVSIETHNVSTLAHTHMNPYLDYTRTMMYCCGQCRPLNTPFSNTGSTPQHHLPGTRP